MAALDIEYANALSAEHQRHREFGLHAFDGVDVARILRDIADANRLAGRSRGAGDSLPHRNAQIFRQARRIADGEAMLRYEPVSSIISTPKNS